MSAEQLLFRSELPTQKQDIKQPPKSEKQTEMSQRWFFRYQQLA